MRILVTGHKGFVGGHVARVLQDAGHEVGGLDNGISGVNFAPKGLFWEGHGNLQNIESIPVVSYVVHCAARADVASNWLDRQERERMWSDNFDGTVALLEATSAPMVFISTCAVYGDSAFAREEEPVIATSPYAASKIAGEALVSAYAFKRQQPWYAFRLGCVVGSNYHHGHVADFVKRAGEGKLRPMNNGWGRKSFIHVLDVAKAVRMAVSGEMVSGVYNVTHQGWSPRDTVRMMGLTEDRVEWPANSHGWVGDPMALVSNAKLQAAGWHPTYGISQGVEEALASLGWKK